MQIKSLFDFIVARENHRIAKKTGWRGPWTPDPIISEYRFCNVRRNDDRVTIWVHQNILDPFAEDPNLWFYLVIARLFNKPETLRAFTYQQYSRWNSETWRKKLKKLREAGPIFNGAYIVSTNGIASDKVDYLIDQVLSPMWLARKFVAGEIAAAPTLNEVHGILMAAQGLGSFMAAQIVADLKYAGPVARWSDFHTFAASGPGSRRGLNRVLGAPVHAARSEDRFRADLQDVRTALNKMLKACKVDPLTAQDVQNCLCEFDKYERARLGEGRPKQRYTPRKDF